MNKQNVVHYFNPLQGYNLESVLVNTQRGQFQIWIRIGAVISQQFHKGFPHFGVEVFFKSRKFHGIEKLLLQRPWTKTGFTIIYLFEYYLKSGKKTMNSNLLLAFFGSRKSFLYSVLCNIQEFHELLGPKCLKNDIVPNFEIV